ncbi:MAG: TIGR04255 family protein [Chitinophagaceae bacterium]
MGRTKLRKAPLQEAIFEVSWQSPLDATGFPLDKDFELALGKFDNYISKDFPFKKRILPTTAPGVGIRVYGRPVYQFWQGNITWPVVQLGPGLLTVNDTEKNYEWDSTYRPNIVKAIESLNRSYEHSLNFNRISLKYIDSVDVLVTEDPYAYISKNLQTDLKNNFSIPGKPLGFNINQAFEIDDSVVGLSIQTAINNSNGNKALVWMTSVEKLGKFNTGDILNWLDNAHKITSDLFIKMLNPEYYASFDQ